MLRGADPGISSCSVQNLVVVDTRKIFLKIFRKFLKKREKVEIETTHQVTEDIIIDINGIEASRRRTIDVRLIDQEVI